MSRYSGWEKTNKEKLDQFIADANGPKKNKYGAVRVQVDGIYFDSKAEAAHYNELKLKEKAGLLSQLECHPTFPIFIKDKKICVVELDFRYWNQEECWGWRYIDIKGKDNPLSALKRKLVEAAYGIKVEVIK